MMWARLNKGQRVTLLRQRLGGGESVMGIAADLDTNREAVRAFIRRHLQGVPMRRQGQNDAALHRQQKVNNNARGFNGRPRPAGVPRTYTPKTLEGQPTEGTKLFLAYRYLTDCAFPMWADGARFTPESMVCGRSTEGRHYCPVHRLLTYRPTERREAA
jgi:hypothetical protein